MALGPGRVEEYVTAQGISPFSKWLESLRDRRAQVRIDARLARLRSGNTGDCKSVGDELYELRIDYGPGYRVYFAQAEKTLILLLLGGDKTTQTTDIERAKKFWRDYRKRRGKNNERIDQRLS